MTRTQIALYAIRLGAYQEITQSAQSSAARRAKGKGARMSAEDRERIARAAGYTGTRRARGQKR